MAGGQFRELLNKYGKVAIGVHLSVSAASISGFYVCIKNNFNVIEFGLEAVVKSHNEVRCKQLESIYEKVRFRMVGPKEGIADPELMKQRNRAAGALALAVLCNKALFPVRVPITIAVTIARFLARGK